MAPLSAGALKPRKFPRQPRARATVEAIVEAAARILEAEGPDSFNTNAVARRAGVSVGSLYQYFPGKQALIAELGRRNAESALTGLAEAAARTEGQPLLVRLRAFVRFAIAQQGARPGLARRLDLLEEGLNLDTGARGAGPAIVALLTPVLATGRRSADPVFMSNVAGDCLALTRALIDRPLQSGETGRAGLEERVVGALVGYLAAAGVDL